MEVKDPGTENKCLKLKTMMQSVTMPKNGTIFTDFLSPCE